MRNLFVLFAAAVLLSACAAEEEASDSRPTITVTGFSTSTGTTFAPDAVLRLPTTPETNLRISATVRDDQQVRSIRFRIEPEFTGTSAPGDSVWRTESRADTLTTTTSVLTNRPFVSFTAGAQTIRSSNAANGGPYRLRITVIDAEGNVSEERIFRIEVTN